MSQTLANLDCPRSGEEAIRSLCYPGLHYRNEYYFDSLPVYERMVNLAFHHGAKNVLELGAGLSTALWARYASRTYAKITTIDADFEPMRSYLDPELSSLIDEHVQLVQGVTIGSRQMQDFYSSEHELIGDVPISAIAEAIEMFCKPAPQARMDRLAQAVGSLSMSAWEIFFENRQSLRFPPKLLDQLSPSGRFAKDVAFLDQHPRASIESDEPFDFIFFDSGEYSSAIEWLMLQDRIAPGGLAAFHDIFFPKSVKNFLVCAAIVADPDWQVVLLDDSTIQGLLIAQKLK